MFSLSVVKDFDVLEDVAQSIVETVPQLLTSEFCFQSGKLTFCDCIIPTVSLSAHGGDDAMVSEHRSIGLACILASSV